MSAPPPSKRMRAIGEAEAAGDVGADAAADLSSSSSSAAAPPAVLRPVLVASSAAAADSAGAAPEPALPAEVLVEEAVPCISMVTGPGEGTSVLAVFRDRHEEPLGEEGFMRHFSTREACVLRLVCREFRETVDVVVWNDLKTRIGGSLVDWRASFPLAIAANMSSRSDLFTLGIAPVVPFWGALARLNLAGTLLGDAGVAVLAPALPTQLRCLQLANCSIGPAGAQFLAPVLATLGALTHLDLADNVMRDAGIAALAPALPAQLRRLQLANCGIGIVGAQSLVGVLPGALTHLNMENNSGLDDACIIALAPALPLHLRQLWLGWTNCGDAGMIALVGQLRGMRGLTHLHLECNQDVDTLGYAALAGVLPNMAALEQLDLRSNYLCNADMVVLARAFPSQLLRLNVSGHSFDGDGLDAFAAELPRMTVLVSVDLRPHGTSFFCEDVCDFVDALPLGCEYNLDVYLPDLYPPNRANDDDD